MKKFLMTLAAVLCCTISLSAQEIQEGRNRVYKITLGTVTYTHEDEKMSAGEAVGKVLTGALTGKASVQAVKYEGDVKNSIIRGLSNAHRYRFNDGIVMPGDDVEEGQIIADAVITNIQATVNTRVWEDKNKKKQTETQYRGNVSVMLNLKDAKTGETVASRTFNGSGTDNSKSLSSTQDQAIRDAINRVGNQITAYLNNRMPLTANLIEGATSKKDKQKEVYIDLGSSEGAYPGLHMGVFVVRNIAGKEAKQQIGKLKIEEVQGEEISLCKVQSGGKDIKGAIDAGLKLVVLSTD